MTNSDLCKINYDNVDDRKEIFNIIQNYLTEAQREQFLIWACRNVGTPLKNVLRPGKNSTFHEKEVYWQLNCLILMHGLNEKSALDELVKIARLK